MNLKQKLSKKLKKTGGSTLNEMLIVVAIIAILVAVSIPMVNANLEKAREATDAANERAAKSAAMIQYLMEPPTTAPADGKVYYDYGADGTVIAGTSASAPIGDNYKYGQGTKSGTINEDNKDKFVKVEITIDTTTGEESIDTHWTSAGAETP